MNGVGALDAGKFHIDLDTSLGERAWFYGS